VQVTVSVFSQRPNTAIKSTYCDLYISGSYALIIFCLFLHTSLHQYFARRKNGIFCTVLCRHTITQATPKLCDQLGGDALSIKCVLIFSIILYEIFSIRRIQRDININVCRSLCKIPLFLSYFNKTLIYST
jgi:hypothetical protein